MKYMLLIALITIVNFHMLKVGFFIFLFLISCMSENTIAHEHDYHECDHKKSSYVHHNKSKLIK